MGRLPAQGEGSGGVEMGRVDTGTSDRVGLRSVKGLGVEMCVSGAHSFGTIYDTVRGGSVNYTASGSMLYLGSELRGIRTVVCLVHSFW